MNRGKVHLHVKSIGGGWLNACGNKSVYVDGSADLANVTCLQCRLTRVFRSRRTTAQPSSTGEPR